jgi:hypothetical protein
MLPMQPGLPERRTHDYLGHGTTTLFVNAFAQTIARPGSIAGPVRKTQLELPPRGRYRVGGMRPRISLGRR